ncbi:MAG TPA: hypothetical protein PLF31_00285 [Candidatus Paceibacterota bacterium]|nr:hypothetical protein [Candidatus Paceibacterota bacterium]
MLKKEQSTDLVCATCADENSITTTLINEVENLTRAHQETGRTADERTEYQDNPQEEEHPFQRPPNDR